MNNVVEKPELTGPGITVSRMRGESEHSVTKDFQTNAEALLRATVSTVAN